MSTHLGERLSALLDGDLDEAAAALVRAHVAGCAECRVVLADLEIIRQQARVWADVELAPSRELWTGVARRLEATSTRPAGARADGLADTGARGATASGNRAVVVEGPTRWYRRRWSLGLPELALAASLAAAVGGALAWSGTATAPSQPDTLVAAPIIADPEPTAVDSSAVTPVSFADAQYDAAVGDLERVLRDQRQRLNPRTVMVVEQNLRVIDAAIREAGEALAADPANALLNAHLASARRRKLDLLRRAALIIEGN